MKVNELDKSTTSISARINSHYITLLKESEINISNVVEGMIGYFLTLPDAEKVRMLQQYSPDALDIIQLQYPKLIWSELKKQAKRGML